MAWTASPVSATYVCLDHRQVSRYALMLGGSRHCPVDGADMTFIGTRWRAPKANDDKGWAEMGQMVAKRNLELERRTERNSEGKRQLRMLAEAEPLLTRWKRP